MYHDNKANLISIDNAGKICSFDLADPAQPALVWEVILPQKLDVRVQASPVIWDSKIVIGRRDGYIYSIGY